MRKGSLPQKGKTRLAQRQIESHKNWWRMPALLGRMLRVRIRLRALSTTVDRAVGTVQQIPAAGESLSLDQIKLPPKVDVSTGAKRSEDQDLQVGQHEPTNSDRSYQPLSQVRARGP